MRKIINFFKGKNREDVRSEVEIFKERFNIYTKTPENYKPSESPYDKRENSARIILLDNGGGKVSKGINILDRTALAISGIEGNSLSKGDPDRRFLSKNIFLKSSTERRVDSIISVLGLDEVVDVAAEANPSFVNGFRQFLRTIAAKISAGNRLTVSDKVTILNRAKQLARISKNYSRRLL